VFALVAALVTVSSCWLAWQRVRASLVGEFEQRLRRVAASAAGQLTAEQIEDARSAGEESPGYLVVQVQLLTLRTSTSVANASLIDTTRLTLVDVREPLDSEGLPSVLDSLAGDALARSLRGETVVSPPYRHGGRVVRAGFAPVPSAAGRVAGVVAIEDEPKYDPVLAGLAQTLTLISLASLVAIAVLAAFIVRAAGASTRLERRLSRAENLAAMGRLTATLAHEIKNPLAIIRGSAERLRASDPEARRMAGFVIEEADRLSKTVARYLQFARGGAADGGEHGDAIAALDSTLDLLEGEFRARQVSLERSRGAADSVTVRLDPESLKQVYLNLLLNALEAMPAGGRLGVGDRVVDGRIEITITDEGPGIAPEVLRRIGDPFFTTKAQGSGLGLFLTRRLVRSSGGDLEIDSEAGRGTTCRVKLPRA
jgi:signal transduction histidine kinase